MSHPHSPSARLIDVEICWVDDGSGSSQRLCRESLRLLEGATVAAALEALVRTDLAARLADGSLTVAVFGEHATTDTCLQAGDRVELLASLSADPKLSRARRAEVQRQRRGDARWQRR